MQGGGETTETAAEQAEQLLSGGQDGSQTQAAEAAAPEPAPPASDEPTSVLDAVKRVMDKGRAEAEKQAAPAAEATPAAAPDDQAAASEAAGDDQDPERLSVEEMSQLSEKARRRFNKLYRQARTAETQLEKVMPDAQATQELQRWAQANNVTAQDYTFALQFAATLKNDPAAAWRLIQPAITHMRQHIGEELPEDLAADVNEGTISRERAQELAAARAERARRAEVDQRRAASEDQQRRVEDAKALATAASDGIKEYEASWRASDPDYAKKMKPTWDRMLAIMAQEGQPKSKADATNLIKRARKDVEDYFATLMPPTREKRGIPPSNGSGVIRTQPKSALEAAKAGLATMSAA